MQEDFCWEEDRRKEQALPADNLKMFCPNVLCYQKMQNIDMQIVKGILIKDGIILGIHYLPYLWLQALYQMFLASCEKKLLQGL